MFVDTLIIGNGFAGRAIAHSLNSQCLIVERGEAFNIFERRQRFMVMEKDQGHHALIRRAYTSKHTFNTPEDFSEDCRSEYILVDGGCSNHWGGLSFRLSENVFASNDSDFPWPFSYQDIKPFYETAETLLRVSADAKDPDDRHSIAQIKGATKWHQALHAYFPGAYIGAQAHNLSLVDANNQGQCVGAGDCELCPMDAKTRALHIRANASVRNGVMVDRLHFDGGKAIEAICTTEEGILTVRFNRVIVAAHGVESLKLLCKSNLPDATPKALLGHHYQDHAIAELACLLPGTTVPFFQVNTAAQVVIPELSGECDGIEYTTLGLMTPSNETAMASALDIDKINDWRIKEAISELGSMLNLFVLLEIPPEWDISLSWHDGKIAMDTTGYHENKARYDQIIARIYTKLEQLGAKPLRPAERRHYLKAFGTHHLVGMLSMGNGPNAVVDPDFKLKGTDNVFVAGSALFPRCGSRNPTTTVVALSLMLAEQLNSSQLNKE